MNTSKLDESVPVIEISPFDTKEVEKDGVIETVSIMIPECCREGWPSCPHVLRKEKPAKKNIGL